MQIFFLMASSSAGAPALKYGDVNTVTPSPGEVKALIDIIINIKYNLLNKICKNLNMNNLINKYNHSLISIYLILKHQVIY